MRGVTDPALSARVLDLAVSPTIAIQQRSAALQREGRRIFRLGLGQSPFPVPLPVVEALRANAHQKYYLPPAGLPALREAAAEFLRRRIGSVAGADDVVIAPGSKELMFLTQVVFEGDLLIPTPAWVSYAPQARTVGREVVFLHTTRQDGWLLRPEQLEAHCRERGPRPRMLILNAPSNPTGNAWDANQLIALAEVARRHGIIVLSDEIYTDLTFKGRTPSMAGIYPEGTIISTGLSKWCGAGGWRLGVYAIPPGLRWLRDALIAVASETYTSTSAPIQYAAVRAFQQDAALENYLKSSRAILKGLCDRAHALLTGAGAACVPAKAAFYLFPDFEPLRERLAARGITDPVTLAERLLEDTGVATLPGVAFGRPAAELTLRLSLVDFDGGRAQGAFDAGAVVDDAFIDTWCAPTVEAVRALSTWIASTAEAPHG